MYRVYARSFAKISLSSVTHAANFEFFLVKVDRVTDRCEVSLEEGATNENKIARLANSRNHESDPSLRRIRHDDRGGRRVRAQRPDKIAGDDLQMLSIRRGIATIERRFERRRIAALRVYVERVEAVDLLADASNFRLESAL